LDRVNYTCNADHYYDHRYSQAPQEDGQQVSRPEAGQASAGGAASGASGSYPAPGQSQSYQDLNAPVQIPPSPGLDWEYLLRAPQPVAVEDIQNEASPEPANHHQAVETQHCKTSDQVKDSAPLKERFLEGLEAYAQGALLKDCSSSLRYRTYINNNGQLTHKGISLYRQFTPAERTRLEQAIAARQRVKSAPLVDEQVEFMAGLEAFGQGALLKDCSSVLRFSDYIKDSGEMVRKGIPLYKRLTAAEKTRLDQAIIARQGAKLLQLADEETIQERFLAGLDNYVQGAQLKDCSATLSFRVYVSDDGCLKKRGRGLRASLSPEGQEQLDKALLSRKNFYRERPTIARHFLAGLDNYAQGVPLKDCSANLKFSSYVSDDGRLHELGRDVRAGLSPEDQDRVDRALLSRSDFYWAQAMAKAPVEERFLAGLDNYAQGALLSECSATLEYKSYVSDDGFLKERGQRLRTALLPEDRARLDQALLLRSDWYWAQVLSNKTIEERFLAGLDNYAQGVKLKNCSATLSFKNHVSEDGHLQKAGRNLYATLSPEDQRRVDEALAARGRKYAQHVSGDAGKFMATLEPYANGLPLEECRKLSGLKRKVATYLTPEGGLTRKGKRLIENLQSDQQDQVSDAITKRQRHTELNPQVPEPAWQWPEMLSPVPETGVMDPAAMADPMQTDPMQTDAMQATTWQLTGQVLPGPSESAAPIPYYGSEAVGAVFQHQYGPNGLIPPRAPDHLIDREIVRDTLINIQGEVYSAHDTESLGNPTNENP
jgi:hypothetical protein